jgi:multifunctional methyltransferase subunit TRM112
MKLLTLNFLTCAIKACKTSPQSFPLHMKECVLEKIEITFQPSFIRNILPRVNYDAMQSVAEELGLSVMLPGREEVESVVKRHQQQEDGRDEAKGEGDEMEEGDRGGMSDEEEESILKKLHTLLLETSVQEGKLVCGNCGFEYPVKEGVGNFLLPAHLV